MTYRLGVDVGTTFTAAAVANGFGPSMLGLGNRALQVPSVLFLTDAGEFLVGEAAERRGMSEPGRVVREFKRRIGDHVPVLVGGTPFSPEVLTAHLLAWVVHAAAQQIGEQPSETIVTHPANWGTYKLQVLADVLSLADIGPSRTCTEPVAAAALYAGRSRVEIGDRLAVYDLGGGTFDTCVLEQTAAGFRLLGTPEGIEHCGGVDFDEALFRRVLTQLGDAVDQLDNHEPAVTTGLARLRRDVVEAKEALSTDVTATVAIALPGINTTVRITRSEFETMIRPAVQTTIEGLDRAIRSAGLSPEQLTTIVLVGGSSRIPLVGEMLHRQFRVPVAIDTHPKHDVALGATVVDPDTAAASTTTLGPVAAVAPVHPPPPPPPLRSPSPSPVEPPLAVVAIDPIDEAHPPTPFGEPSSPPSAAGVPEVDGRPARRRRLVLGALAAAVSTGIIAGGVIANRISDSGGPGGTQPSLAGSSVNGGPATASGSNDPPPAVTKDPLLPRSTPLAPTQVLAAMSLDGGQRFHIYRGDSSNPNKGNALSKGEDSDFNTVIAPDRQSVLFTREFARPKGGPERALKVMAVDGSRVRNLFERTPVACSRSVYRPAWNPIDQTLLALPCQSDQGVWSLILIHTDGRQVRLVDLGNPPGVTWRVGDPTFSSDGKQLVFWAGPSTNRGAIYVSDLSSAEKPRRLTDGANGGRDSFPTWHRDGKSLLFNRVVSDETKEENLDIYQILLDGTGKAEPVVTGRADEQSLTWSPAGDHIAFRSDAPTPASTESLDRVWISDPGGKGRRLLFTGRESTVQGSPSWTSR